MREVTRTQLGRVVPLTVWRDGQQRVVPIRVAAWPDMVIERGSMMASASRAAEAQPASLGLALEPVTDAVRKQYQLASTGGALVTGVQTDAEAYDRGVAPGDVILKVQGTPVSSAEQVRSLVDEARSKRGIVALLVSGKSGARWVSLYVGKAAPPAATKGLNASSGPETGVRNQRAGAAERIHPRTALSCQSRPGLGLRRARLRVCDQGVSDRRNRDPRRGRSGRKSA